MASLVCPECGAKNSEFDPRCQQCGHDLPTDSAGRTQTSTASSDMSVDINATWLNAGDDDEARIGRYRLFDLLGRGGMGEVYRARDEMLNRAVALKLARVRRRRSLTGEDVREAGQRTMKRFVREAQITSQLSHPNIVPIYELGTTDDGSAFFSMKLVEGDNLSQVLRRDGAERLQPRQLTRNLRIFLKVCQAVSFAHSRGVVHRDIKPSNIMIGDFGQVYLMDWGTAMLLDDEEPALDIGKMTDSRSFGKVVGTIRYMSPEQVGGDTANVGIRSDIFSLGATLYHILGGQAPYMSDSLALLLNEALVAEFPPLAEIAGVLLPPFLAEVAGRAMARDPADRYETAAELHDDVEAFIEGAPGKPSETFAAGERIVSEGDEGADAYVIMAGRCEVIDDRDGERRVLRTLEAGDVFGEAAIFSGRRRTATVEAVDEVTVTPINREVLASGRNPWLERFVRSVVERFSEVDERRRELERLLADGK